MLETTLQQRIASHDFLHELQCEKLSKASAPPLRAALIGLGSQARREHLVGLQHSELAEIVAVCDADDGALAQGIEATGAAGYRDYHKLLDREQLDFLVVSLPHALHAEIVLAAAARGLHVLKEKPLATSLEEGMILTRACQDAGVHMVVATQRRFDPTYRKAREMLATIGEPVSIELRYSRFHPFPQAGWRGNRKLAGGGCLIDGGYHFVDCLTWFLGLPTSVFARLAPDPWNGDGRVEDTAVVFFQFQNGSFGTMSVSRQHPCKEELFRVVGRQGTIEATKGQFRRLLNDGTETEVFNGRNAGPIPAATIIDEFCRIIQGEQENSSAPHDHLDNLRFIEAVYLSAATGRPVDPRLLEESYVI